MSRASLTHESFWRLRDGHLFLHHFPPDEELGEALVHQASLE
jgi:hypothetical protein